MGDTNLNPIAGPGTVIAWYGYILRLAVPRRLGKSALEQRPTSNFPHGLVPRRLEHVSGWTLQDAMFRSLITWLDCGHHWLLFSQGDVHKRI
jgi:hypothetical protein